MRFLNIALFCFFSVSSYAAVDDDFEFQKKCMYKALEEETVKFVDSLGFEERIICLEAIVRRRLKEYPIFAAKFNVFFDNINILFSEKFPAIYYYDDKKDKEMINYICRLYSAVYKRVYTLTLAEIGERYCRAIFISFPVPDEYEKILKNEAAYY